MYEWHLLIFFIKQSWLNYNKVVVTTQEFLLKYIIWIFICIILKLPYFSDQFKMHDGKLYAEYKLTFFGFYYWIFYQVGKIFIFLLIFSINFFLLEDSVFSEMYFYFYLNFFQQKQRQIGECESSLGECQASHDSIRKLAERF